MVTDRGLLDTSTLILLGRIDRARLPAEAHMSAVSLAELSVGPVVARDEAERADRMAHLQQAEASFNTLAFDADAARAFGRVASALRRAGRKPAARTYDSMIAATALANDLPLYTCNPEDFRGIEGLRVVAVPHPDQESPSR